MQKSLRNTLPALILTVVLLTFPACTQNQIQNVLTAVSGWARTSANAWEVLHESLFTSGQISESAHENFLNQKKIVDSSITQFDGLISAVKDKQGAIQLLNALIPVANKFIASGLVIKNPKEQARAIAIATAASLVFQTITAAFGHFQISVPSVSAEYKDYEQKLEREYQVEFTVYVNDSLR